MSRYNRGQLRSTLMWMVVGGVLALLLWPLFPSSAQGVVATGQNWVVETKGRLFRKLDRPEPIPSEYADLSFEELRAQAKTPRYNDLLRNAESYQGELVYFVGKARAVLKSDSSSYKVLVEISKRRVGWDDPAILLYSLDRAPRILPDDTVAFVGFVGGVEAFKDEGVVYQLPRINVIMTNQ